MLAMIVGRESCLGRCTIIGSVSIDRTPYLTVLISTPFCSGWQVQNSTHPHTTGVPQMYNEVLHHRVRPCVDAKYLFELSI